MDRIPSACRLQAFVWGRESARPSRPELHGDVPLRPATIRRSPAIMFDVVGALCQTVDALRSTTLCHMVQEAAAVMPREPAALRIDPLLHRPSQRRVCQRTK